MSIQSTIIRTAGPLGGFTLGRYLTRNTPKILMYHRFSEKPKNGFIDKDCFAKQIRYISKHFNILTMEQASKLMYSKIESDRRKLKNVLIITVDDGYSDFYSIAAPILKEFNVPATLYVTTRFIDGDFWLWPDKIRYILEHSERLNDVGFPSQYQQGDELTPKIKDKVWGEIIAHLLSISEDEKASWIEQFSLSQSVSVNKSPSADFSASTWTQLQQLHDQGIEIGAHTRHHPSLGQVNSIDRLKNEIQGSVDDIAQKLGVRPKSFCFPNGQPTDYTDDVKRLVSESGASSAVTAFYDKALWRDPFEIRRFTASHEWFQFAKSANGIEMLGALWRNQKNNF